MPLTMLDATAALIVVDLQKGFMNTPTVHPVSEIVGRAAKLARAFRGQGLPIVLVNATGGALGRTDAEPRNRSSLPKDWTELVAELEQQPGDMLVSKQRPGAFIGTALDESLRRRGVTQVFVVGIATRNGVEATARSAYDYGYNVVVVVDAITDVDAEAHRHCVEKVFPRISETDTAGNVLKLVNASVAL